MPCRGQHQLLPTPGYGADRRLRKADGCVAKTGGSLVEVAKVPTVARPTHPVHEPKGPIQVASLPIRHYPTVCAVVSALSSELPKLGRNDAGTGANGRSHNGVSMAPGLCSRTGQAMQTTLETNQ